MSMGMYVFLAALGIMAALYVGLGLQEIDKKKQNNARKFLFERAKETRGQIENEIYSRLAMAVGEKAVLNSTQRTFVSTKVEQLVVDFNPEMHLELSATDLAQIALATYINSCHG